MEAPRWTGSAQIRRVLSPELARRLIREALERDVDPSADPPRMSPLVPGGQLLIMPSSTPGSVGVKVLSVAPGNPARGLERIQALYVLFDADTLTPTDILDGSAITSLRTPAVSAVAVDALAPAASTRVTVFGAGPQAIGHVEAILAIRRPHHVTIVTRHLDHARAAARQVSDLGVSATPLAVADERVAEAVTASDIIVTATSAAEPVLDGRWVSDGACVVAIGSHEPDRRELDAGLMGRALVVVEDVGTALREAGDVVMAISEGALAPEALHPMKALVTGELARATDRPNVFKSVGMSWEDLVIAAGIAHA
ncbi:ornithine cyclodeaminase family protein [Intrasporangium sp. DVR]